MKKINSLRLSANLFVPTRARLIASPHLLFFNQHGGITIVTAFSFLLLSGLLLMSIWFSMLFVQKSKLEDVLEQAAIAVAVNNNENRTAAEIAQNQQIVRHYLSHAFQSVQILSSLYITCYRRLVKIDYSPHLNMAAIHQLMAKDEPCESTVNTTDMLSNFLIAQKNVKIEATYEKTYHIESAGISFATWKGVANILPSSTPFTSISGSSAAVLPVTMKLESINSSLNSIISSAPNPPQTPKLPPIQQQVPIDLIFTADFSGSMAGKKLETLKQELITVMDNKFFNNNIGKESRVGVVPFTSYVLDEKFNCYNDIDWVSHIFQLTHFKQFLNQNNQFFTFDALRFSKTGKSIFLKYFLDEKTSNQDRFCSLKTDKESCFYNNMYIKYKDEYNHIENIKKITETYQDKTKKSFYSWQQAINNQAPNISEKDFSAINKKYLNLSKLFEFVRYYFSEDNKNYNTNVLARAVNGLSVYTPTIIPLTINKKAVKERFSFFKSLPGGTNILNALLTSSALLLDAPLTPKKHKKILFMLSDGQDQNDTLLNDHDVFEPHKTILESFCDQVKNQGIELYFLGIEYNKQNKIDWKNKCFGSDRFFTLDNINQFADKVFKAIVQVQRTASPQTDKFPSALELSIATATRKISAIIIKQGIARNINF